MTTSAKPLLSIVLPVRDEQAGLTSFHKNLSAQLDKLHKYDFEIIYCNDGSRDGSLVRLRLLAKQDERIRIISLSRSFGKEIATTAGIQIAQGKAVLTLDSDGQHPVELIPKFIQAWQAGANVVVGVRTAYQRESLMKRVGSYCFYKFFNRMTGMSLVAGATDFRLIDQAVQTDFKQLTERNRITRGLVDWLGYERAYVNFVANPRRYDSPAYSFKKLLKLALDSMVSLSSSPLYVTAYIGAVVLPLSTLLGLVMGLNQLFGDPLNWHVTGSAYVVVLILFLIGILMMSQGIIGLYLSHIHSETQNRPLYVVNKEASWRL